MTLNQLAVQVLLATGVFAGNAGNWGYEGEHGVDEWGGLCKTGIQQSPIAINSDETVKIDFGPLKFIRYDYAFRANLTNTGHSIQINLFGVPIMLQGGDLPSTYVLEQMHFHWNAEHTVDGVRDPLELHFVHYDEQYGNVSEAMNYKNGIAVVAVLFQLSDQMNPEMSPILRTSDAAREWVGPSVATIPGKVIPSLLLPRDRTIFYRYHGSLTTPGCQESVIWTIMAEKLTISEQEMKVFRSIRSHHGILKHNNRDLQDLNERKVYLHLEGYMDASSSSSSSSIILVSLSLCILLLKALDLFTTL